MFKVYKLQEMILERIRNKNGIMNIRPEMLRFCAMTIYSFYQGTTLGHEITVTGGVGSDSHGPQGILVRAVAKTAALVQIFQAQFGWRHRLHGCVVPRSARQGWVQNRRCL